MKKSMLFMALAISGLMAGTALGFNPAQETAILGAARQVQQRLVSAKELDGKDITILPVHGDEDDFAFVALLGAFREANKICVVSNDEKDPQFKKILANIRWDEQQATLKSVDPKTIDELGHLKSTQILLEAKLKLTPKKRRVLAELILKAYAIQTKQYVWTAIIAPDAKQTETSFPSAVVRPATFPLNLSVVSTGSGRGGTAVAARLETALKDQLAKSGKGAVDATSKPDATVTLKTASSLFDQTGSWIVLEGTTHLEARSSGADARLLGETDISAKGARGLGEAQAAQSLAADLVKQAQTWAAGVLAARACEFESVEFTLQNGAAIEGAADIKPAEALRAALAAMEGVRKVELKKQDNAKGTLSYCVVYEKSKYPGGFLNAAATKNAKLFEPFEAL